MGTTALLDTGGRKTFSIADMATFRGSARTLVTAARSLGADQDADRLSQMLDGASGTPTNAHALVCTFLDTVAAVGAIELDADNIYLVQRCAEYDAYLTEKVTEAHGAPRSTWRTDGVVGTNDPLIETVVNEMVAHVAGFSTLHDLRYNNLVEYTNARVRAALPPTVAALQHEANLAMFYRYFEQSLTVPGDVCEFGCFRGNLSVKLAWLLKAAGTGKHYYTFDTFSGFEIADPGGGLLGVGAFSNNDDAYASLSKWAKVIPLTPVKGDATKTVEILKEPLSFVWLDLDMAVLMDPVLRKIWPLCHADTLIGIDDVGREETPTVLPWVTDLLASGAAEEVFNSDLVGAKTCIRVVRKTGELPPSLALG